MQSRTIKKNVEITCQKCNDTCVIDGEYPKFFAWCDTCKDYAQGFDCFKYAADYYGDLIDQTYDNIKDRGMKV